MFEYVNLTITTMYHMPEIPTEPIDVVVFLAAGLESVENTEPLGQTSHVPEFR